MLLFQNTAQLVENMFSNLAVCSFIIILLLPGLLTKPQEVIHYGQLQSVDGEDALCVHVNHCTFIKNILHKVPLSDDEKSFLQKSQCGYTNRTVLVWCPQRYLDGSVSSDVVHWEQIITYGRCTTPNGERGLCIKLNQCTVMNNLLKKVNLSADEIAYSKNSQCGYTNGSVLICCPGHYLGIQPTQADNHSNTNTVLPKPGACGNVISDRILGGHATQIDEFPWTALIQFNQHDGRDVGHLCGGSLINPRYVLSAAHCFHRTEYSAVLVRLGEWDTSTDRDCVEDMHGYKDCADPHLDVRIDKVIPHARYNARVKVNDIALLRLSDRVNYTDFIRPICLPVNENLKGKNFEGTVMDVAGWGVTENGTVNEVKQKAAIPVVNLDDCRRFFSAHKVQIYDTQLCAGGEVGVDSCRGDSGGSLVALDNSNKSQVHYFLSGITSFGAAKCGSAPGVYTKVSEYTDWIIQNILAAENSSASEGN